MKTLYPTIILLIFIGCENPTNIGYENPTNAETSINKIIFQTDKISYSKLDSIRIMLDNKSNSEILIGLRCSIYLEMFYQKKENNVWSDNLWFWYMSLACPTLSDTIESNNKFNYSMKSEIFDSTGTYRLGLNFYNQKENIEVTKYSNSFEIK